MNPALPAHILVVDDDRRLRALLKQFLTAEGFTVSEAASAAEARRAMDLFIFDLMVLDVMMPGETGLQLAGQLRGKAGFPPILLLTAAGTGADRVAGLEAGVEDYITKPFEPRELVLRLGNILKRAPRMEEGVRFGPFRYAAGLLEGAEGEVYLTGTEQALLEALAGTPGQPVSREALAAHAGLGGGEDAASRAVDAQIARLRKKIEPDTARPRFIQTVRGAGYKLVGDA